MFPSRENARTYFNTFRHCQGRQRKCRLPGPIVASGNAQGCRHRKENLEFVSVKPLVPSFGGTHTIPRSIKRSSIPKAFLQSRTPTRMEKTIQVNTSKTIAQYRSATPSPATATVPITLML
jgi:hypothetical protein